MTSESVRIFPTWHDLKALRQPLTPGELTLLRFLDESLSPEWEIYAQPYFNGDRPDVVILHPQRGIVVYEVKDWHLAAYTRSEDGAGHRRLYVDTAGGLQPIKSPLSQAAYYREKLIGQLNPAIGESIDGAPRTLGMVRSAVYMHGVDTEAARAFLAPGYGEIVFGSDALVAARLTEIAPLVREFRSYFWRPEWTETARFWLRPPFHALEQGRKFALTPKQREFAAPQPGHRRIRGVAGSGKTLILAERAARLASEGKSVLVVTFNITLWHYIHDMVARAPHSFDWERINFTHFHGFCGMLFNRFERSWPQEGEAGDGYFRETVPKAAHALVDEARQNGASLPVYDAILIDEGQDFSLEWYRLLCRFLGERNELLLVCDQRQNVYGCELGWLEEGMKGTSFRGRWGELKTVFRLPPLIADATQQFCRSFDLNEGVKADSNQQGDLFQPHLVWRNMVDGQAIELMWQTFQQLQASGVSPSDVVFLLLGKRLGLQAVEYFTRRGIEVNHVFDPEEGGNSHKRSFWLGDGRLKMCTVESFKGWEIRNVVLLIPERTVRDPGRLDALVYTAMTRSRENLIVLNGSARYANFGETLPGAWQ